MSWWSSLPAGLLTALIAGIAGGLVAARCVDWYRISSFEGKSAYFVVGMVLVGAFAGFFAGVIVSRCVGGFFTSLGVAACSVFCLAGVIAGIAWGLADIPPTIHGHELTLVIEARLPKGAEKPAVLEGRQFVWFESGPRLGPARASRSHAIETAKARFEDGRWVVPGSVPIFTTRNRRRVVVQLDDKEAEGFELPFPGHPGEEYKQWSPWLPNVTSWPDSRMSYRFQVEEIVPASPAPDPFRALTSESPLREWLQYFDGFARDREKYQAIMKQVEARPADLAEVLRSENDEDFGRALNAVYALETYDQRVVQAMRDVATDLARKIRRYNGMAPESAEAEALGARVRDRFSHWCITWGVMQGKIHSDGRTPVEEILKLASVRPESASMHAVAEDARYLLGRLQ